MQCDVMLLIDAGDCAEDEDLLWTVSHRGTWRLPLHVRPSMFGAVQRIVRCLVDLVPSADHWWRSTARIAGCRQEVSQQMQG